MASGCSWGSGGRASEDTCPCARDLRHQVPRCRVLPAGSPPSAALHTPRNPPDVSAPRSEGPPAPPGLSLENKPGSCLVSSHPRLPLPEGTLPTAGPGPRRVLLCHRRHSCPCACITRERAWLSIGLPRPWGQQTLLRPDVCLSEHPCVCIRPCNLPPAGTDSSGTEKGQTSRAPPHGRHSGVIRTLPPAGGCHSSLAPSPHPTADQAPPRPPHLSSDLQGGGQLTFLTLSPRCCFLCLEHLSPNPNPPRPSVLRSDARLGPGPPLGNPQSCRGFSTGTPPVRSQAKSPWPAGLGPSARCRAGHALSPWQPPSLEDTLLGPPGTPPTRLSPGGILVGHFLGSELSRAHPLQWPLGTLVLPITRPPPQV